MCTTAKTTRKFKICHHVSKLKLSSNNNNNNTNNSFATYTRLQVIEGKKTTAAECATLILARVFWKFIPDLPIISKLM
jgi:plastocyanin domain-containing protein